MNNKFHSVKASLLFSLPLFVVRGSRPGKNVQLTENEIRGLCLKSREIFLSQPILLELEAPLKICGKDKCLFWYDWCRPSFLQLRYKLVFCDLNIFSSFVLSGFVSACICVVACFFSTISNYGKPDLLYMYMQISTCIMYVMNALCYVNCCLLPLEYKLLC